MEDQNTDTVIETTDIVDEVVEEVQADSVDTLIDNISDGLFEEDQPIEEVIDEPETLKTEPEKKVEEEPEKHKVKVDGEEQEIDYTELVKGYQTNRHNTQTAQQLADSQRQLAPVIGLAKRLEEDPEFAKHVFGYGKQQETELDPIEQIKADAVKAALEKVDEKFKGQTEQTRQAEIATLRKKVQADPLYDKVQGKLNSYVMSMPEQLQRQIYDTLDKDPVAYTEMYQRARETIEPAKKEEKKIVAPVLVNSGQTPDIPLETLRKQKLDKKRAEVLKSGDPEALEDYFMMEGGLIDSLGL